MRAAPSLEDYFVAIGRADVSPVAAVTPLEYAPMLSERLGNRVLLKREDRQSIFSFKCRGAYHRIASLVAAGASEIAGVIAASAGNHAQGVALAASRLGLDATIVMPVTTPPIKVAAVRRLGATVELQGDDFDEALAHSRALAQQRGLTYIHPFDDVDTIIGQGTVAREIAAQVDTPPAALFTCVGGGGLAAGIGAYLHGLGWPTEHYGVEDAEAACMLAAYEHDGPVALSRVGLFADGAAVRVAGRETYRVCRATGMRPATVTADEIAAAIKDIFVDTRTVVEPAGALGLAGLKRYVAETGVRDQTLVAIVSGANVNFDRLRHVIELTEVGVDHECLFAVTIPERPGSFLAFSEALGKRAITEFNYRRAAGARAEVFAGVKVSTGPAECRAVFDDLEAAGYDVADLTQDDTARLHIRHMIGGRLPASGVGEGRERLFRFQFPERPGALRQFLRAMDPSWDITLFHYRNHGAAFGRVLVGLTLPPGAPDEAIRRFGERLGYPFSEETSGELYARFLR